MKIFEFKQNNLEFFMEDDCKEKEGSIDAHLYVSKYIFETGGKVGVAEASVIEIDKLIKDLEILKMELKTKWLE